ncbi:hypothetical protein H4S14_003391 [Agrobacterium vitis]|nr:hypothetical protein [Agrobacterium vitis]MBE1439626.1 hypothetical protein [Agrobacterium vitis]
MDFSRAPIARMEALIRDRLRIAFPADAIGIQRVPRMMSLSEFTTLAQMSPVMGLAWRGMKADPEAGRRLDGKMRWRLTLIYKAANGADARFKGDDKGLGLDAMVDVSMSLLHGWMLPEVGRCTVTRARGALQRGFTDDTVALAHIDFKIGFATPVADYYLLTLQDFRSLAVTWSHDGSPEVFTDTLTQETS